MIDMIHLNAIDNVELQILDDTGKLGQIKEHPVGTPASIDNAIITYVKFPINMGMPIKIYVEEPDRSAGIAILSTNSWLWFDRPNPGDKITADGTLTIIDTDGNPTTQGEVVIAVDDFTKTIGTPSDAPKPLIIANRYLGGASFGIQQGVFGGIGLSNIGMLVKIYGEITSGNATNGWITDLYGNNYAYIDDGSHVQSGVSTPGVKIIHETMTAPESLAKGTKIEVVGISSVELIDGVLHPVVYIREFQQLN
jgi:hypothetical protein